jgi:hypothetical protein
MIENNIGFRFAGCEGEFGDGDGDVDGYENCLWESGEDEEECEDEDEECDEDEMNKKED